MTKWEWLFTMVALWAFIALGTLLLVVAVAACLPSGESRLDAESKRTQQLFWLAFNMLVLVWASLGFSLADLLTEHFPP